MPQSRSYQPTSIRLNPRLKKRMVTLAKERGHTLSSLIAWLLQQWVDQVDKTAAGNKPTNRSKAPGVET